MSRHAIYLCGGDTRPAFDRGSDCPSPLHDWPLPSGYVDAGEEANRRLARRWSNKRCPQCHLYGWQNNGNVHLTTAEHWLPQTIDEAKRRAIQTEPERTSR